MAHPSFENLLNLATGALSSDDRASVEAHVNQPCSHCQAHLRKVTELIQIMANDQTVAPPPPVLQRMLAVIKRLAADRPRLPVRLIFDSWRHAPLAATRSATQAQQLLFAAEGLDIDLHFTPGADNTTVRGQILGGEQPEDRPASLVVLQSGEEIVALTRTDRHGQFVFQSVPAGTYDLHIELEQNQIAIEGLQLGQ
jgi:hypothetical protein